MTYTALCKVSVTKRIPTTALHCEIDQLEDWIVGIGRPDPEGIIEFWQVCLRAAEKIVDTRHTSVVVNHELVGHKTVEIGVNCDGRRESCLRRVVLSPNELTYKTGQARERLMISSQ